jgi:hypothetical protein
MKRHIPEDRNITTIIRTRLRRGYNGGKTAQFFSAFLKLRKVTISFVMSVLLSVRMEFGSQWADFMKFDICGFFENLSEKIQVPLKSDKNSGTVHED